MNGSLKVGNTAEITTRVTEDMCPAFDGVIVHRLYSTWSMAEHMELAARMVNGESDPKPPKEAIYGYQV